MIIKLHITNKKKPESNETGYLTHNLIYIVTHSSRKKHLTLHHC